MKAFRNADGERIVREMIAVIQNNVTLLSEIDGAIGDGDHGINMKKGFSLCAERLNANPGGFTDGLKTLGRVLMAEIGGSMGPLYGSFFNAMARTGKDSELIDAVVFGDMLDAAVSAVTELGGAKVGDKTLVDVLVPALGAYEEALAAGGEFDVALEAMRGAAEIGKESTRNLVAKIGRSARLGERSRGVLDAGATSCALLLGAMVDAMHSLPA
ncbi:MAG TPA: dihydroxyacetone kinase subunit DhaL [Spirochaetia bacterium]|nr:dihydroxyacetone kinase subunit DhaL [Spirochaetia bacterium]